MAPWDAERGFRDVEALVARSRALVAVLRARLRQREQALYEVQQQIDRARQTLEESYRLRQRASEPSMGGEGRGRDAPEDL
jgi:hypothetical protein